MRRRVISLLLSALWFEALPSALGTASPAVDREVILPSRRPAAPRRVLRGPLLAVAAVPRLQPEPTSEDFLAAWDLAREAGARGDFLSWRWSELESSPQTYLLSDVANQIAFLGGQRGLRLLVGIQVLNTTAKETPPDLAGVPFDSPQMKERFRAFLDALLPLFDGKVAYFSIGNEVDVYLGMHSAEWEAYRSFYEDAAAYVHAHAPGVRVGVTSTFGGASGSYPAEIARLNERSDVFLLTYYPLDPGFLVRPPSSPVVDFPRMISLAGGRPVLLQEVGYPSSPLLGSSETMQAEFVASVFTAWLAAQGRISFLSYFALHDFTDQICETLTAYYGLPGDASFKAYLCTLGLRHVDGTPKPAWQVFQDLGPAAASFP